MNILADILKIIGLIALIVMLVPLLIVAAAYVGYFYGILVTWMAGGILSGVFGINSEDIPKVFAWLFVLALLVRNVVSKRNE